MLLCCVIEQDEFEMHLFYFQVCRNKIKFTFAILKKLL